MTLKLIKQRYTNYIWLVIAICISFFANGIFTISITTWLAPVFFIKFMRKTKLIIAINLGIISQIIIFNQNWLFFSEKPVPFFIYSIAGVLFFIPYLIDIMVNKKNNSFITTLVLPLSFVIIEYMFFIFSPYDSFGNLAVTQIHNKTLIQVVSLVGISGITFIIFWSAAVINWIWENNFNFKKLKAGVLIFGLIYCSIIVFGEIRINSLQDYEKTVRVAGIGVERYNGSIQGYQELFSFTEKQARAGAEIICWSEFAFRRIQKNESELILQKAKKLAKNNQIYLIITYSLDKRQGNYAIVIDKKGDVLTTYSKKHPPFDPYGIGRILNTQVIDMVDTKIGLSICIDALYRFDVRQMNTASILFIPAAGEKAETRYLNDNAALCALENGFSIIRPESYQQSIIYDYCGNKLGLAQKDPDNFSLILAEVPTQKIETLYSLIGDTFVWLSWILFCIILAIVFIKPAFLKKRKSIL